MVQRGSAELDGSYGDVNESWLESREFINITVNPVNTNKEPAEVLIAGGLTNQFSPMSTPARSSGMKW
jgi:hypothetical protein